MRKTFVYLFFPILSLIFAAACSSNETVNLNKTDSAKNISAANAQIENSSPAVIKTPEKPAENKSEDSGDETCKLLKKQGYTLDKKQTFAIDFAPFQKSCFVVFHNPEFVDSYLGAQYFIYRNGKEIFRFPEQFNGGNTPCSVKDVAFEDLNDDNLTDIIIAGKCGAKGDDYNENMVYINTGKQFETDKTDNMEMIDFETVSDIKQYLQDRRKTLGK